MKVIATRKGYYGSKVREPGEEFGLRSEADFSEGWMKPSDGAAPKAKAKAKPAAQVQETEVKPPVDPAPVVDPITGSGEAGSGEAGPGEADEI